MGPDFSFTSCVGNQEGKYLLQLLAADLILAEASCCVGIFNVLRSVRI